MFDLSGKTALITGASGGIGGAIARAMHSAGAQVMLCGTRAEALNELRDGLKERAHVATCDLSDGLSLDNLIKTAETTMGRIDILVNNAGITRDTLLMRMKDEDWHKVIEVNLTATFRLSRAVLRPMIKNRFGRILSITSVVGVTGNPGQANYAASKAGMIGFTKSLAQEVATRGITANCIAPGFITTPMTAGLTEDQRKRLLGAIPAGRFGTPEDIAAAALYLASEEAAYVTGQTLHVNGGMAMI